MERNLEPSVIHIYLEKEISMKTTLILAAIFHLLGIGTLAHASPPVLSCTIQTVNGNYLTAVGSGGRITDVLHTDATRAAGWEQFTLIGATDGSMPRNYGIRTKSGNYLTAVGGGGRITDVIHSDATQLRDWEKFKLISLGGNVYAIQTINGRFLTAVGGGGRIYDVIHSDAMHIRAWEKFRIQCRR